MNALLVENGEIFLNVFKGHSGTSSIHSQTLSPSLGPTLDTERLIPRPPVLADLDGFATFGADPEAAGFLGGRGPRPVAWRVLAAFAGAWALQGFGMFSVVERASGRWIGRVGPWCPEGWPGTEIGWAC